MTASRDGASQRDHLLQACRQLGKSPQALGLTLPEPPEPPAEAVHIWHWFHRLSAARGNNGFGYNPLTWADMAAYARFQGVTCTPWEAETLHDMDMAFLAAHAEANAKK